MQRLARPSRSHSVAACSRLVSLPQLAQARCVALFASLSDEPSTRPLFEELRCLGLRCLLPRTTAARQLEFCEVSSWEDLRVGRYGVSEPAADSVLVSLAEADVVVVPGVAFDASGGRLGRGKGYYDRALAQVEGSFVVGLALEGRVVEEVPRGDLDQVVDAVVTERRVLSRKR
jgi:5-formyltetrahydrofolate cyclo-ligase